MARSFLTPRPSGLLAFPEVVDSQGPLRIPKPDPLGTEALGSLVIPKQSSLDIPKKGPLWRIPKKTSSAFWKIQPFKQALLSGRFVVSFSHGKGI